MLIKDSLEGVTCFRLYWQHFNSYATLGMFMALCKCYIRTWRLRGVWNGACEHRKVRLRTSSILKDLGPLQSVQEEAALHFPLKTFLDDCVFQVDCCVINRFILHRWANCNLATKMWISKRGDNEMCFCFQHVLLKLLVASWNMSCMALQCILIRTEEYRVLRWNGIPIYGVSDLYFWRLNWNTEVALLF